MQLIPFSPRKSLNKTYLKVKPTRSNIERFKINLIGLLDGLDESESEEHNKNDLGDFLKNTFYHPKFYINTKDRTDLVIHNGNDAKGFAGILIEAKKPSNKTEMIRPDNLNAKAFHELILYYLRERITNHNLEVKHLVVTNIYEWYVFDAALFEKTFAQDKTLVKQFTDFEEGRLAGKNTDFFYNEIAEPFVAGLTSEFYFTWFDFRDYDKPLRNEDKKDDSKLIALYKLLSPEHLLKLPFANDSNSLDKTFYTELLHIIGLTETKEGSKKLIGRKKESERNSGSFIESAIIQLDSLDKISRLDKPFHFGETVQERLFNVALELSITWINRILFLKLLEAQLIRYHKGDASFAFLNCEKVQNFDDLNTLFFSVLARKQNERNEEVRKIFGNIPYLNSSLFEPTGIEHSCLFISQLKDGKLPILASTVLKDNNGKRFKGELFTLEYLFKFLDAYDFAGEGSEEIQEENKTLINASVLGLIFEKINGYKDGSFFTPGFITMYMCRETISRAVVQKFKERKGWNCEDLKGVYDKIEDKKEANEIINQLKICDPAVGSGHFLVSALNEIISIKSELKILSDKEGKRLKEYHVEVVNDELIITDEDGKLFEYNPNSPESQRVQEAIFHEKQTIIENCLFGVDINPNSVKICRLRLWIELLKNAYYKESQSDRVTESQEESQSDKVTKSQSKKLTTAPLHHGTTSSVERELETLPNIDINIKCGNSLISRYALDADIRQALKKSKWNIESYRLAVMTYRNAENKEQKRVMADLIEKIKNDFQMEISMNDPKKRRLDKLLAELYHRFTGNFLFEPGTDYGNRQNQDKGREEQTKLENEISKISKELEEVKNNKIYENSFEWRFEFPEVLNDDGDFVGFDVVIGNPPYMRVQEIQASQPQNKFFYELNYSNAQASYDLANIFFELAVNISSSKSYNAYIFPHKFFNAASSEVFRNYLIQGKYIDKISHFGANMIFEDADTYTCVAQFSKSQNDGFLFKRFGYKSDFQNEMVYESLYTTITYEMLQKSSHLYGSNQWILFDNLLGFSVFSKIYSNSKIIKDVLEGIFVGLQTSKDELYVLEKVSEDKFILKVPISGKEYELETDLFKPFLMGKDVQRYCVLSSDKFVFFPYKIDNGKVTIVTESEIKEKYPKTYIYLTDHDKEFKARESGKAGKMAHWYSYIYPKNLNKFEQPKLSSMEICANHPNVTFDDQNFYHTTKVYSWVKKEDSNERYEYLLAIANSQLLWWFLKITGDTLQGDARTFKTNYLNPFPLPLNLDELKEKEIVEKVNTILNIKKSNPYADTSALEKEIDKMVYELYGLTGEEIGIIENG
jgi:hypothetical protein